MKTALIGYTGFVGSNISNQYNFTDLYNSKNIDSIHDNEYDLIVSAANRAEMWKINQEPEKDLAEIKEYISHIKKVKTRRLVLISTVGVYKKAIGVDEDTPIDTNGLLPYGANRYYLEEFCKANFSSTIIRLPGLFGKGLKKNVIYDLIHNNNLDRVHNAGIYQYYNLDNIWKDIQIAINNNLGLVNFATEPVSTKEVAEYCLGIDFNNKPKDVVPAVWDMQSKYASFYGSKDKYLYNKQQELEDIKKFIEREGKLS